MLVQSHSYGSVRTFLRNVTAFIRDPRSEWCVDYERQQRNGLWKITVYEYELRSVEPVAEYVVENVRQEVVGKAATIILAAQTGGELRERLLAMERFSRLYMLEFPVTPGWLPVRLPRR